MDSRESARPPLPAHLAPLRPATPMPSMAAAADEPKARRVTPRILLTGLGRYWKLVLPLWLAISAASVYLVYILVKPSYEATSLIRIDQGMVIIPQNVNPSNVNSYLQGQVSLIKSTTVLSAAVLDERVRDLPLIQKSEEPVAELKNLLITNIRPNTDLVDISIRAGSLDEAKTIVDAVVTEFLKFHETSNKTIYKASKDSLETYARRLNDRIKQAEANIKNLAGTGVRDTNKLRLTIPGKKAAGTDHNDEFDLRDDQYQAILVRHLNADIEVTRTEAFLALIRARYEEHMAQYGAEVGPTATVSRPANAPENDPDVRQAYNNLKMALSSLNHTKNISRNPNDPSVRTAQTRWKQASDQYKYLLESRSRTGQVVPGANQPQTEQEIQAHKLAEAEEAVQQARATLAATTKAMDAVEKQAKQENNTVIQISLYQSELATCQEVKTALERQMAQLDFDLQQRTNPDGTRNGRVTVIDKASGLPATNKRVRYMAVAPLGVLAMLLLGVTLLEIRSGRVTHPDDLTGRLRAEVFTVPPLPTLRAAALDDQRRLVQVEEFAQRMDHLRVALCGAGTHGEGRCVMITSAMSGEGKTILAAQLAGRCANAGLSTLLIDADLRRPMLARLLEVPEQPGLIEVLAGDVEPEAALAVIGSAGGFHLLPAGGAGPDPSRLFSGPAFGELLQRLRAAFDVVIVDTPPVLPVPDALQLGRWADGAVLAVRHDNSRSHLVERANHLLDSARIPLLGVVVNGVRESDSTYNSNLYGAYTSQRNGEARVDAATPS